MVQDGAFNLRKLSIIDSNTICTSSSLGISELWPKLKYVSPDVYLYCQLPAASCQLAKGADADVFCLWRFYSCSRASPTCRVAVLCASCMPGKLLSRRSMAS